MGLFDLMDVGLCRWWVCLVWWMSGVGCPVLDVGLGCGFVWFGGWFVPISLDFFFFFLRWRWWMCGSDCWWPSVLLRQWLLVDVVAAWWLGRGW